MATAKSLPARPNLVYLRKLAKERLDELRAERNGEALLANAQLAVAREHGFASWRRLKTHVDGLNAADPEQVRQFMDAIRQGDIATARKMLRENPRLAKCAEGDGQTPLLVAVENHNGKLISMLIEAGADPVAFWGKFGHTPLSWAVTIGALDSARALVEHGVRPDLYCAAGMGDLKAVKSLFDKSGKLLRNASKTGSSRFAADGSLLPCPPATTRERISDALYIAARQGHVQTVQFLLQHDPDLTFRAYMGGTPLHWAYFSGVQPIIDMLLTAGARQSVRDDVYQCTPRAFGICVGASWGIMIKVNHWIGVEPDLVNIHDGRGTPLHEAARSGNKDIVRILLDAGADQWIRDKNGRLAFDLLKEECDPELKELLKQSKRAQQRKPT